MTKQPFKEYAGNTKLLFEWICTLVLVLLGTIGVEFVEYFN